MGVTAPNEQNLRSRRRRAALLSATVSVVVIGLLGWLGAKLVYPYEVGPAQPIPFSHRIHAGVREISCFFCHDGADRSQNAGMPEVGKCMLCHNQILTQFAPIQKEHAYYMRHEPVPWVRVNQLPDYVHFRHQIHLANGVDCSRCHGDVKAMDRVVSSEFTMGFCIDCHKANNATQTCSACHY